MYYISKITFDNSVALARRLANVHDNLHAMVWWLFPNDLTNKPHVVYSIVNNEIYVVSSMPTRPAGGLNVQCKEYDPNFINGMAFNFDATVNPVKTNNGKRFAILKYDELLEWMQRQGSNNGFSLLDFSERGHHKYIVNGEPMFGVNLSGVLQVNDPDKFKHVVLNGIGKAKAYGMGLLRITRI